MIAALVFVVLLVIGIVVWMVISRRRLDAAWRQFADELGAGFVEGGLFGSSKVQAHFKNWAITLDTFSVSSGDSSDTYTRMRAPLLNTDGFQFTIFRMGFISKLDKALGAQDIDIGDPEFDRDFVIQGNNESKVRALFANQNIRRLIQAQRSIRAGVRGSELLLEIHGVVRDVERLKTLFELIKGMLDQLEG